MQSFSTFTRLIEQINDDYQGNSVVEKCEQMWKKCNMQFKKLTKGEKIRLGIH